MLVSGLMFLLQPQSLKYGLWKQSDNEHNPTPVPFAVDYQLLFLHRLVDILCHFFGLRGKQGGQVRSGCLLGADKAGFGGVSRFANQTNKL